MFRKRPAETQLFGLTPLGKLFAFGFGAILFFVATYAVLLVLCSVYGSFVALTGVFSGELTKGTLAVLVTVSAIIVGSTSYFAIRFAVVRPTRASISSNEEC